MLLAVPAWSALVARVPRIHAVSIAYRLVLAVLVTFSALIRLEVDPALVARAFFVWVSVMNLFVISVLWSIFADTFTPEQGKRLFGLLSGGLSAGALLGLLTTGLLVRFLGVAGLLFLSAALLELSAGCAQPARPMGLSSRRGHTRRGGAWGGACSRGSP